LQRQTQDSPSYADALRDLGRWYLEKRRFTDAEPLLEKALAIITTSTAIPSPTRAAAYVDLGDLYDAMQEQEGAEPDWRHLATLNYYRAVALIGADNTLAWANATVKMAGSFGPPHPDDDFTAFLAARLSRALAVSEQLQGPDSPIELLAREHLVLLYRGKKNKQAYDTWCPATLKGETLSQARLLVACAAFAQDTDQQVMAQAFAQRALATFGREQAGSAIYQQVQGLLVLAQANLTLGHVPEAESAANQGIELCDRYLGKAHALRGELLDTKASVLDRLKRKPEAKQARQQSDAIGEINKRKAGSPRLIWAKALARPEPQYTPEARSNKIQGSVVVVCEIGIDGQARPLFTTNRLGYGLDEAALAALRQWRFEPMRKDGQPVPMAARIQVNFKLR
jgi:protein TonB